MQLRAFLSLLVTVFVLAAARCPVIGAFAPQLVRTQCFSSHHRRLAGEVAHQLSLVSSSQSLHSREAEIRRVNIISGGYVQMTLSLILSAPILFVAWLGYSSLWAVIFSSQHHTAQGRRVDRKVGSRHIQLH